MVRTRAIQETEEERDDSALLVLEPNQQNIDGQEYDFLNPNGNNRSKCSP